MSGVDNSKKKPFLSVKKDVMFHFFFADERNEEELIGFLKSIIDLPDEDYNDIEIADPTLLPDYVGDKYAIIDVKLRTKSRKIVHIEVQLHVPPAMRERIVFYSSKLITEQIGSGDEYYEIKKAISIVITEKPFIHESPKYLHHFLLIDRNSGIEFTDIIEIYTLELKKLPVKSDGTALYNWAKFINAETEDELDMAAESNPLIRKAVVKVRELSADERIRDMIERREKGRRDFEDFMRGARAEGRAEGEAKGRSEGEAEKNIIIVQNAMKKNIDIDTVIALTGLSRSEIENIQKSIKS